MGLDPVDVRAARVLDNGPVWHALLVASSDVVLGLKPDHQALQSLPMVGVVGPHPDGHPQQCVHIDADGSDVWVGGSTTTVIEGDVTL